MNYKESEKTMRFKEGLVQVYTGEGKGKTTAALGIAVRAVGHGFKVFMVQFMKKSMTGELNTAHKIGPALVIKQWGRRDFIKKESVTSEDKKFAQSALEHAFMVAKENEFDILILDEVTLAIDYGLIDVIEVLQLINEKPRQLELIITGRRAPSEIIESADLVTEMVEVKHPFRKGIKARKGIEY